VWNKLFAPAATTSTNTKGSNTYAAGLTATAVENPTISFVPIQGQDFAQRFESSVTDKLTLFLEDLNIPPPSNLQVIEEQKSGGKPEKTAQQKTAEQRIKWLLRLFAENFDILHGDKDCHEGFWSKMQYPTDKPPEEGKEFDNCMEEVAKFTDTDQIDANIPITSATATIKDPPTATEEVSALAANLRWAKAGNENRLANVVKIPALLDYDPIFKPEPEANKELSNALISPYWEYTRRGAISKPPWKGLAYTLPPKYQWYRFNDKKLKDEQRPYYGKLKNKYILLPESKVMKCKENGDCDPVSRGEETSTTYQKMREFTYGDKLARYVWPYPYDEVYIESRNHEVTNEEAEQDCTEPFQDDLEDLDNIIKRVCSKSCPPDAVTSDEDEYDQCNSKCECKQACKDKETLNRAFEKSKQRNVLCGFIKVGNLIQILQNLADLACTDPKKLDDHNSTACEASIFGIGFKAPPYAIVSAPYTDYPVSAHLSKTIWVPAHDPKKQRDLYERDKFMFLQLYKLYQMSLVDTSKLVTGTIPITISK